MRRTIRLLPAFLFCLILFNSNLQLRAQVAQAAADDKKAAPAEMTKFSTRTQLVLVPVVVTGKNGSHMSGLTRDAFRIEEHGRVRQATIFEEVKSVAPDAKGQGDWHGTILPKRARFMHVFMRDTPSLAFGSVCDFAQIR